MKLHSSKLLKLTLGIFSFFVISYIAFDLLFNMSGVVELYIKELPTSWITALIIIVILISDILIPIPSSIVMVVSGILFGGFLGGIIALTGAMAGSIINFQISRTLGQVKVRKWLKDKEYERLSGVMHKHGVIIVILTRIIPIAMESVSSIAGISSMKLRTFILLNIVGFIPTVFLYSYAGELYKNEPNNVFIVLFIGFFVPLIIWYLLLKIAKQRNENYLAM